MKIRSLCIKPIWKLELKLDNFSLKAILIKYLININCCNLEIKLIDLPLT